MNKLIKILVLVVVCGLLVMGCNDNKPAVVITYEQRINFEVFDPDPAAQQHQKSAFPSTRSHRSASR